MNIDDIKKTLKTCNPTYYNCKICPYKSVERCVDTMNNDALNIITEQEEEIERLKAENKELTKVVSSKVYDLIDNTKEIADAREAWEKQAKIDVLNELKEKIHDTRLNDDTAEIIIEMIEELKK